MPQLATKERSAETAATLRYVTPFLTFLLLLMVSAQLGLPAEWDAPIRFIILAAVCLVCWPRELTVRVRYPLLSCLIGIGVFVLWILPELLLPGYRSWPLFSNSLVGHVHSSLTAAAVRSPWVLTWRTARAAIIVPVVEELFWRGWLMRWIVKHDFERVPLGAYTPAAFWITAVLFASEHGPYWDVGLLTGAIYNLWMIRSRSIADCILVHAITNAALSAYVIIYGQWQYWQ